MTVSIPTSFIWTAAKYDVIVSGSYPVLQHISIPTITVEPVTDEFDAYDETASLLVLEAVEAGLQSLADSLAEIDGVSTPSIYRSWTAAVYGVDIYEA